MRPQSPLTKAPVAPGLVQPTPAQLGTVMDGLEHSWSENSLLIQQRLYHAIQRDDHNAVYKYALSAGISTEKLLLIKGRPTEIVGHLHAHRYDHGSIMGKLARALGVDSENRPVVIPAQASPLPSSNLIG